MAFGYNHDGRHSEEVALGQLWTNPRRNLTFVNFRLTPSGRVGLAKPCYDCQELLFNAGIKRGWYTDIYGEFDRMWL